MSEKSRLEDDGSDQGGSDVRRKVRSEAFPLIACGPAKGASAQNEALDPGNWISAKTNKRNPRWSPTNSGELFRGL
jgi:hypothetical protein